MFQAGDVIVCGTHGVCRVEKVGPLSSAVADRDRLYYTLKPLYERGSVVFTPVDNEKMVIRPVISREEALRLIDGIRDAEALGIEDERKREENYKTALKSCRAEELVKMIKTINARKRSRAARGKKATDADSRYVKLAEDYLYGELAISLDLERDQVKAFIRERIGEE
ncbi:MAG TPA: CarD family transcriptional regulator [Candidatus Lachnoclostridium stercoripullorum]|uniref:CarD family transcriptional regulator n=1 Tax=Candidatus Lachnoclostridium stercoripullorum TaxID=2838635 RepID=A0A9D1W5Y0_9FIRM|nr:CarD family transcriptional regulator [Candidatus Lachnoclostridium stercoripullorum]